MAIEFVRVAAFRSVQHKQELLAEAAALMGATTPGLVRRAAKERSRSGPDQGELQALVEQIASRVGRVLERCGLVEVIASIEEPEVIAKILAHLQRTARDQFQPELPLGARAPPPSAQSSLL